MKMLMLKKLLLVIAILFVGFLGGSAFANIPPEVIYEPYPVEVEVIKVEYVPKYIIQTEYIIKEVPVTTIREVPVELRLFESEEELAGWLEDIQENTLWILPEGATCVDLALALIWRARQDGYDIYFQAQVKEAHARCSAIIGDSIYFIEPETSEFWKAAELS